MSNYLIQIIFSVRLINVSLSLFIVFYYLCYEGAVDLESITDSEERHAKEVQIMEFGQVPKKIFNLPHPQRHAQLIPRGIANKGDMRSIKSITFFQVFLSVFSLNMYSVFAFWPAGLIFNILYRWLVQFRVTFF